MNTELNQSGTSRGAWTTSCLLLYIQKLEAQLAASRDESAKLRGELGARLGISLETENRLLRETLAGLKEEVRLADAMQAELQAALDVASSNLENTKGLLLESDGRVRRLNESQSHITYTVCHVGELLVSKTAGKYDNFDAAVTEAKRLAVHCEEDFAVVTIYGVTSFSRSADFVLESEE